MRSTTTIRTIAIAAALFCSIQERLLAAETTGYKLKSKRTVALGTFELTTSRLVVADPGYDVEEVKSQGLGTLLTNCRTGTWNAHVVIKEFDPLKFPLTAELQVWHTNEISPLALHWQRQKGSIAVDTGQAGVYDRAHFHDHGLVPANTKWTVGRPGPADPKDLWYSYCCELTIKKKEGGVIPHGVVTSAGAGDGAYEFYIARDKSGAIVGVWIRFVDDSGKG